MSNNFAKFSFIGIDKQNYLENLFYANRWFQVTIPTFLSVSKFKVAILYVFDLLIVMTCHV